MANDQLRPLVELGASLPFWCVNLCGEPSVADDLSGEIPGEIPGEIHGEIGNPVEVWTSWAIPELPQVGYLSDPSFGGWLGDVGIRLSTKGFLPKSSAHNVKTIFLVQTAVYRYFHNVFSDQNQNPNKNERIYESMSMSSIRPLNSSCMTHCCRTGSSTE